MAAPIARAGLKPVLLVPIYVFPHSWGINEYVRLINVQKHHPSLRIVAIVNVDFDGSDWKTDPVYRGKMGEIVRSLDAAGIAVVGYVSSSYTRRPFQGDPRGSGFSSDFKTNVDRWTKFFSQVRGIFVDEMCYTATLYHGLEHPCLPLEQSQAPLVQSQGRSYRDILAYYRALYSYIRWSKGLEAVIANRLDSGLPAILEGDFLLPEFATQTQFGDQPNEGRVRALFVTEADEAQIAANYRAREGNEQPIRAHAEWVKNRWLTTECARLGVPSLCARPWDTVLPRAIAALSGNSPR